jgi:uncharacterized protein YceK
MMKRLVLLFLAVLLSGCATLSEDECASVDWYSLGYEEGTRGYDPSRISNHRKACAEYGVTTDAAAYMEGHEEGARIYCRPANGYSLGLKGRKPGLSCDQDLVADFNEAYQTGLDIYQDRQAIRETQQQITNTEDQINELLAIIEQDEQELTRDGVPSKRRKQLLEQIKQDSETAHLLEEELEALYTELETRRSQLKHLESENPYN